MESDALPEEVIVPHVASHSLALEVVQRFTMR